MTDHMHNAVKNQFTCVDSFPGTGKTTAMFQKMNANPGPWLFITPYLKEVHRCIKECPRRAFTEPAGQAHKHPETGEITMRYSKSADLHRMMAKGANIASTHSLFSIINDDCLELARAMGYTLVIDEVLEVIQPLSLDSKVRKPMFTKGLLKLADSPLDPAGQVFKVLPGDESDFDNYSLKIGGEWFTVSHVRNWAESGRLTLVSDTILLWVMPAECFTSFKRVFNLTYLYEGSQQQAFYKICGLEPTMMMAEQSALGTGYELVPYDLAKEIPMRRQLYDLINVYDGPLNDLDKRYNAYSSGWWGAKGYVKEREDQIQKRIYNYFQHHLGEKPRGEDLMWGCYDKNRAGIAGKGFARQFVVSNARATNDFRSKKHLAYPINWYPHPSINKYLEKFGCQMETSQFATSTMIQWLLRSRLRNRKPINLYLPSSRMRSLLREWANGAGAAPETTVVPIPKRAA
jgi:hypothetical protein